MTAENWYADDDNHRPLAVWHGLAWAVLIDALLLGGIGGLVWWLVRTP